MKGRRIVLDHVGDAEAAALLVDGRLDDLLIDDETAPRPGAVYRAICDRPLKGQGGMIVRLPEGETGWLRGAKGLAPGQAVLAQVTGVAEPGKAVPMTDRVLYKSRYAIVTPGKPGLNLSRQIRDDDARDLLHILAKDGMGGSDMGLILRSAAEGAPEDDVAEDIAAMRALAEAVTDDADGPTPEALTEGDGPHALAWREWDASDIVTEPGGFDRDGVLDAMAELTTPLHRLELGTMFVEATRALVAVDVNTGGDTSPAAALKANLSAVSQLPRALRLRGFGGQIAVDFAPMPKAHRRQVETALRAAFRADPVETSLVGWTAMGLYELQRKRERAPLARFFKGL